MNINNKKQITGFDSSAKGKQKVAFDLLSAAILNVATVVYGSCVAVISDEPQWATMYYLSFEKFHL
jgi:hypothetical protein